MDANSKIQAMLELATWGWSEKKDDELVRHHTKDRKVDHKRSAICASCFRNLIMCVELVFIFLSLSIKAPNWLFTHNVDIGMPNSQ